MAAEELGIPYEQVRADRRRHRLARLQRRDRRQPRHLRHRHGHDRGRARRRSQKLCARAAEDVGHPDDASGWETGMRAGRRQRRRRSRRCRSSEIAADGAETGGPIAGHCEVNADGAGAELRHAHRATSRSTARPAQVTVLRYTVDPGCRQGRASQLCRGPDPGRRGAGHRLGAQRGVHLRRRRPDAECRASSTTACRSPRTCR